jgi:hypothetical protein
MGWFLAGGRFGLLVTYRMTEKLAKNARLLPDEKFSPTALAALATIVSVLFWGGLFYYVAWLLGFL